MRVWIVIVYFYGWNVKNQPVYLGMIMNWIKKKDDRGVLFFEFAEWVGVNSDFKGAYDEEEAAAHAYDLAALKYWGQDTVLNFPVINIWIPFLEHVHSIDYYRL